MNRNLLLLIFITVTINACKTPEPRKPVQHNSGSFISKSVEKNKVIFENEKEQILKILTENKIKYYSSDQGFWYYYKVKDTINTIRPVFGDQVTFTYDVKDLFGKTILSNNEIGLQNYIIDQNNQDLVSGIRDGIKLMKKGETITFLFPSYFAYGYYGIIDKLGTNVPVQCTITLKTIKQKNN